MPKIVLFVRCILLTITISQFTCGSNRVKRGFCSTRNLDVRNGQYRLRSGNSVAEFSCDDGFTLYGIERLVCFGTKWSSDPPICISNKCLKIQPTSTLKIETEFDGAVLKFSCAVRYKLDGQNQLICDGTNWNGPVPSCKPWDPPLTCDFEDPEICGWTHDDKDDQDWRWNSGKTSTTRTGPSQDHTLGDRGDGHYMYFETSSPTRTDHIAILKSPLYPAEYSRQRCFMFWYHIFGEGDIGELEVFTKPESVKDLRDLQPLFQKNENGGDVWYDESVRLPQQTEPFQVLFVATRGTSYRSDIAIDDVNLGECAGTLPPVNVNTTVTTQKVITSTEPLNTTLKTTTVGRTATTQIKMSTTTKKPIPSTPTTTQEITSKETTTTTTRKSTKSTITVKTTSVKQKSTTPTPPVTSTQTNKSTVVQTSTKKAMPTTTVKLIINPHLPSREKHIPGEARSGPSVAWIVIGVAIVLVIAVAFLFALYLYRRRRNRGRKQDTVCSSNPLYLAVNGDEGVHFAVDDSNEQGDF